MPGGQRFGLSRQAKYRTTAPCHTPVATADRRRKMMDHEKVNIGLLVDDQPALLAYEVILKELGKI